MVDLLIIGSGPAGLACAIECVRKGLSHLILEKGGLTDAIRRFPTNMTFFSTPELLEIGNVPFITSTFRPSRVDALRYYQRVAKEYQLQVRYDEMVVSITSGPGGFLVKTNGTGFSARNVVVAAGYYDHPNPYEIPGSKLPKVHRYYTEPFQYFGRNVAIVGGRNSAVDMALELFRHGVEVTMIHRGPRLSEGVKYWLLPDIENRMKAGDIKSHFDSTIAEIRDRTIIVEGKQRLEIPNDHVFVMIGYRPDNGLLETAGVRIEPGSLSPVHDPQSMETNVPGLFVAGSIAAGKFNNKIFIENGRLHGARIVATITKSH
ncbi:MAG: YpdA family putative bacillithiol disulfide reductase [Bacteroidota bacterium]